MNTKNINQELETGHYIFRPYITKNGKRIYAKTYGKKAFKIWVSSNKKSA